MPQRSCFVILPRLVGLLTLSVLAFAGDDNTGGEKSRSTFLVYEASQGPIKGWSHIVTSPEDFPLIKKDAISYAVDETSMLEDPSSDSGRVFRTILVRKLANWGRQHANGLEPVFFEQPVKLRDVASVRLVLKLHPEDSSLPTKEELRAHFDGTLPEQALAELDNGKACLGLSLLGPNYNDQSVASFIAYHFASFEVEQFDQWLTLDIEIERFNFAWEKNYGLSPAESEELLSQEIVGFRINPESTSGKVARNFIGDAWDDSVPELYKELSLSLERIEFHLL